MGLTGTASGYVCVCVCGTRSRSVWRERKCGARQREVGEVQQAQGGGILTDNRTFRREWDMKHPQMFPPGGGGGK